MDSSKFARAGLTQASRTSAMCANTALDQKPKAPAESKKLCGCCHSVRPVAQKQSDPET